MGSLQKRKLVLITGASTGIGLAIARLLLKTTNHHLVLTARAESMGRFEKEGINESDRVWLRPLDVLSKKQRDFLVDEIEVVFGQVDVLINNAGYMLAAVVEHVGEEERLKQMDTNFRAPLSLIRRVLPKMRESRSGQIINISSVGGMMAMPTMSIYSASKFALEGATEALWYEVKPWNIKVTLVQPGFVNSDGFSKVVRTRDYQRSLNQPYTDYYFQYQAMGQFIEKLMKNTFATPESVARVVVKLINKRNPALRVSGTWDAMLFSFVRRFLPRSIYHYLFWYMLPRELRTSAPTAPRKKRKLYGIRRPKSDSTERPKDLNFH